MGCRLLRALPGVHDLVSHRRLQSLADLTPAQGRQDHTTWPPAARINRERQDKRPMRQRPSHPAPRIVTIARNAPQSERDARTNASDLGEASRDIYENRNERYENRKQ